MDLGSFIVKCISTDGDTLTLYSYKAAEGEEVDLLADTTPLTLRASNYETAQSMTTDPALELAQKILNGQWVIVSSREPSWR